MSNLGVGGSLGYAAGLIAIALFVAAALYGWAKKALGGEKHGEEKNED